MHLYACQEEIMCCCAVQGTQVSFSVIHLNIILPFYFGLLMSFTS